MLKHTIAMVAAGLLMVGCTDGGDNKPAESKKEMKAPATQPAKAGADAAKPAASMQYAELKQGETTWVVGSAEGAAAVKAGKKPAHQTVITGGKKVYFEQDKDGKLAAALMTEYDKRHAKK